MLIITTRKGLYHINGESLKLMDQKNTQNEYCLMTHKFIALLKAVLS